MGAEVEIHHAVPRYLLRLHDAAKEQGLDGRHIQAWIEFEHEALRWGVPIDIERNDLEAMVEASEAALLQRERSTAGELDAARDIPMNWSVVEVYRENGRTTRFVVEGGLSEQEAREMASEFNENLRLLGITGHWAEAVPDRGSS